MNQQAVRHLRNRRRGSIVPVVACALLVVMSGLALVLDRMWLDFAQVELRTAAEAAALAGARELVNDDLLRPDAKAERRINLARDVAVQIAAQNLVAGQPCQLDPNNDQDIRVGRLAVSESTGTTTFLETDHDPRTMLVTARKLRSIGNPVALLMRTLTGQPAADLSVQAEATAENDVIGVEPIPGFAVPAFPLAILSVDPLGKRMDTWQVQIIQRRGADRFGYDDQTGTVTETPDGIPEIVLTGSDPDDKSAPPPNMKLVDIGTQLRGRALAAQIVDGWTVDEMQRLGGSVQLPTQPFTASATSNFDSSSLDAFQSMLGQARICLLYLDNSAGNSNSETDVRCVALVAGRVMSVIQEVRKAPKIIFQPAIVVTRTALMANSVAATTQSGSGTNEPGARNQYIFKVSLTQ